MFTKRNSDMKHSATLMLLALGISGCASYTTPGGPVDITDIQSYDIRERMSRSPAADFPALLTVARVQSAGYSSKSASTYGSGNFVVVTNRELLSDDHFKLAGKWTDVRGISPLSRLLIPPRLNAVDDLRIASAALKADILVLFTIDTTFRVDGKSIGPLSVVSLGLLRDRETVVNTTASAILVDVRTGFVYGVAESTASERQPSSVWTNVRTADQARLRTERDAFDGLFDELGKTWQSITAEHNEVTYSAMSEKDSEATESGQAYSLGPKHHLRSRDDQHSIAPVATGGGAPNNQTPLATRQVSRLWVPPLKNTGACKRIFS